MVKFFNCSECYKISEIRSDNETDMYIEPRFCPFCGYHEATESEMDYSGAFESDIDEEY